MILMLTGMRRGPWMKQKPILSQYHLDEHCQNIRSDGTREGTRGTHRAFTRSNMSDSASPTSKVLTIEEPGNLDLVITDSTLIERGLAYTRVLIPVLPSPISRIHAAKASHHSAVLPCQQ